MRVLYLSPDHGVPVQGRKGCSTHVRETCRALARRGHQVLCLAGSIVDLGQDEDYKKDPLFELEHVPHVRAKWLGADLRLMLYNRRLAQAVDAHLPSFQPDLIYERYALYGSAGGSVAQRAPTPYMLEVNSPLAEEQAHRLRLTWLAKRIELGIWRGAPALVAVSEPVAEHLASLGVPRERVRVMTMKVDSEKFRPRSTFAPNELPTLGPAGQLNVLYAGALTGWHGVDNLFELVEAAKKAGVAMTLSVLGGMPEQVEPLRERVRQAGLQDVLRVLGSVPHDRVPAYMAAADVGYLPETSRFSSPTKMFEYMAAGLPVLAPQQSGVERVLTHGVNGALVPPGDTDALGAMLQRLAEEPSWREQLGERARADAVDHHSWACNAQAIEQFHAEIVKNRWV